LSEVFQALIKNNNTDDPQVVEQRAHDGIGLTDLDIQSEKGNEA